MRDIKLINDKNVFLKYYKWIKAIPLANLSHIELLGKCLNGTLHGSIMFEDDVAVGICLFELKSTTECFIVGLYLKDQADNFRDLLYEKFKEIGIKKLIAISMHDENYFIRFSEFKKVYSLYEKEI